MAKEDDSHTIHTPEEIKAARKKMGLSQTAFAKRLGVSFATVNRWERGHRKPTRLAHFRLEKIRRELHADGGGDTGPFISGSGDLIDRVVVGVRDRLLIFDPACPEKALQEGHLERIPVDLGGVRSASFDYLYGKPVILVGLRDGVLVHTVDGSAPVVRYPFEQASARGYGTNSAKITQGYLYATHSEQGLLRWRLDRPTSVERLFTEMLDGKRTVRSVISLDCERMLFVADTRLYAFSESSSAPDLIYEAPSGARLTSVALLEHTVYVACSDGRVLSFDLVMRRQRALLSYEQTRLYSCHLARCLSAPFLVLGTKSPQVTLLNAENGGERICYSTGSEILRLATATNRHVIATDYKRTEVIVWEADQPDAPVARIPVAQALKHHIQDLRAIRIPSKDQK